jgi:membrane-associated phospholipid phosphatase
MVQRKYNLSLCLAIAVGAIALAFALGALRKNTGAFDVVDIRTSEIANSVRSACLTPVMRGITWFGYETGLMVVICIIYWLGYTTEAVSFLLMVLFGLALNSIMKDFFELSRPPDSLISKLDDPGGYGYPSGHGQWGVLYAWLIYSFIEKYWPLCLLPVPLLMISRLYLGVHYLSDTIGGLICGLGLVVGVAGIHGHLRDLSGLRESLRRSLVLKVLLSFALSGIYFGLACITPEAFKYFSLSGFLFGFILTYSMLEVRWRPRNLPLTIAVAVIGLAIMIGMRLGLAAILPENNLGKYCRYFVIGVYLAASPLLFLRMRLLTRKE